MIANNSRERHAVGHVAVDSGCIAIVDPSLVDLSDLDWHALSESSSESVTIDCGMTLDPSVGHLGVVVRTVHGDGVYPVYIEQVDGVRRLVVELGDA